MKHLYDHLCRYDADAWSQALDMLSANIAEVDRDATRIWFAFYPLKLAHAFAGADTPDDRVAIARKLGLMGRWGLEDRIDSSHRFLYGHRYWPQVKAAIEATTAMPTPLGALVTHVAEQASAASRAPRDLVLGLSAVGLMTLRQVGVDAFAAAPGRVTTDGADGATPASILKVRNREESQGVFGFLRGIRKQWTVTFNEHDPSARFTAIQDQDLATAAQTDKREYRSKDPRCIPHEGPIPVECRAASCGTCWVGVLGGAGRLTPVEPHEAARMKVFGYAESVVGTRPLIRLACQAKVEGAVSIVIPPWNGIIGRLS
ncbi:MAG TPA: 2Fe-2S iron-sulfur cluster-binding protein [Vicinamibacterales bacterium]|nr:2Fe-2S iron-sulfur cluster-binding protein [Vicinamibacterales bacterium]